MPLPLPVLLGAVAVLGPLGAHARAESRSVLLLRHCPRAPYPTDRYPPAPPNNYTSADDFSARPFPPPGEWGASPGRCTPAGLKLARTMGAALPDLLGVTQAEVFADAVPRCEASAAALGLNATEVRVSQALFDPLSAQVPGCSQPDWHGSTARTVQSMQERLAAARALLPGLQRGLGKGRAPPLDEIPDEVRGGHFVGGLRSASEAIIETFELERTSSLPMAWGLLSDDALRDLLSLRSTYMAAAYGGRDIAQRYASGVIAKLLEHRLPPATVLLGHDLNVVAIASLLGIEWRCGTFAAGSPSPLAGFLFTLTGRAVHVRAVCPGLEDSSPVAVGAASFAGGGSEMPASRFSALARSAIEWRCVEGGQPGLRPVVFA